MEDSATSATTTTGSHADTTALILSHRSLIWAVVPGGHG
jgi:hypothetical protein